MANKYDSTIRDLKATFFDIFQEHTEELAGMIEILAKDESSDVVKMETSIFQRIILLNKAAGNVKTLMSNIGALNTVKGHGAAQVVSEGTKALVSEVVNASMKDMPNGIPAPQHATSVQAQATPQTTSPSVPAVAPTVVNNVGSQPAQTEPVAITPAPAVTQPSQAAPVVQAPVAAPVVQATPSTEAVASVLNLPAVSDDGKSVAQTLIEKAAGTSEEKTADAPVTKNKFKLIKSSDSKVKAILVNDKQYEKLRSSHGKQFKLLDFANVSVSTASPKTKIEDLMKKASTLYKEGKVSEAQALYAEISALNKKTQSEGKPNVLIKKAA